MIRRYYDSGVYLTAWRGVALKERARFAVADPVQTLVASGLVRLGTLPKAMFRKNAEEVAYLEFAFSKVAEWVSIDDALIKEAIGLGSRYDVVNLDALHVAAAIRAGVDQLVTTERPGKPLFRVTEVEVVSLLDL